MSTMLEKEQSLKDIGLHIRRLREARGLSLMDFCALADIDYSNVIRIEKGRSNLTVGTLVKIANALNLTLRELFPKG